VDNREEESVTMHLYTGVSHRSFCCLKTDREPADLTQGTDKVFIWMNIKSINLTEITKPRMRMRKTIGNECKYDI